MATSLKEDKSDPPTKTSLPVRVNINKEHVLSAEIIGSAINGTDLLDAKTVNDKNHCYDIGKKLKNMVDDKVMCDLLLRLGKSEQEMFAHRCILAANSSFLCSSIDVAEKSSFGNLSPYLNISIDTDCIEAFESLLHFMYTGELVLNPHILEEVLDLSARLCISGIMPLCATYLQGLIDINNWMWLHNVVKKYSFGEEIGKQLKDFAKENFAFLVQSNEMVSLEKQSLSSILMDCNSQNDYDVEACKLEMVLKWISFSQDDRLNDLIDLLACLNKELFLVDDLQKIIVAYELVVANLDQQIWDQFVTAVKLLQEERQKLKLTEKEVLPDDFEENTQVLNDDTVDEVVTEDNLNKSEVENLDSKDASLGTNDGFESDNTLPYEKGHDSDIEAIETKKKRTKKLKLKVEPNQSIEYIEEPPSKKRNKRKASYPVKLNVPKKKAKNVKTKQKVGKFGKEPKVPKVKKPKTKSSCTQVTQDEIQDEFEEIAEEEKQKEQKKEEEEGEEKHPPLPVLVKAEFFEEVHVDEDDLGGFEDDNDDDDEDYEDEYDEHDENLQSEVIKTEPEDPDSNLLSKVKIIRREKKALKKPLKDLLSDQEYSPDKLKPFKKKELKSGVTVYECPKDGCSYHAFRPGRLMDHLQGHSGKKRHKCIECNKTFAMLHYLQRHKKIHSGKTEPCELCTYTTCRSDKLRLHYKACHPVQAVEKGYMTQDIYDRRLEEKAKKALLPKKPRKPRKKRSPPAEEIIYSCERCPRKFKTPSALKHHIKGHGASQPFLCEVCGFSTIHFASMNVHKRQHNESLRFRCNWPGCNYTAIRRSRLDDHMCTHKGIKNHVCSVCGKAFAGRKHLHRHELLHKGEKLRCAECPYESTRRDKLRDHIKKHHPATAIMHGFLTQEELNRPKPPPKPRKPRPSRSKKKPPTAELLMESMDSGPALTQMQLKEERFAEDKKAADILDHDDSMPTSSTTSQLPPGYIQLPPHLFPGSGAVSEEVIQYITSMSAHHQQQQQQQSSIHIPPSHHPSHHHSMGQSSIPAPSHENMVGEVTAQPHNLTSTALSMPPAAHSQPSLSSDQQHWGYYQL